MSQIAGEPEEESQGPKISRNALIAIFVVIIIVVAAIGYLALSGQGPFGMDANAKFESAGALYSKSVDLANDGDYQGALTAADQALALNVTPLIPIIQSNRAGILVALGRYDEAISAADVALTARGNTTTLKSVAYYNKANALRALGRNAEADANYANASALDPTLKHP